MRRILVADTHPSRLQDSAEAAAAMYPNIPVGSLYWKSNGDFLADSNAPSEAVTRTIEEARIRSGLRLLLICNMTGIEENAPALALARRLRRRATVLLNSCKSLTEMRDSRPDEVGELERHSRLLHCTNNSTFNFDAARDSIQLDAAPDVRDRAAIRAHHQEIDRARARHVRLLHGRAVARSLLALHGNHSFGLDKNDCDPLREMPPGPEFSGAYTRLAHTEELLEFLERD